MRSVKTSCVYVHQHLGTRQCVFKKLLCSSRSSTHTWFSSLHLGMAGFNMALICTWGLEEFQTKLCIRTTASGNQTMCFQKIILCQPEFHAHLVFFWRCQDEFCNTLASANQGADQPHRFDQTSVDGFHLTELTLRQTGQAASPRASQVTKA